MASLCNICPRNCQVDRDIIPGFCGMTNRIRIARAALHFWEEPCISGENGEGSGAVFFSGCNLRCVFCQNREISALKKGREFSVSELADIFLRLQDEKKALNINLVTGTHYAEEIREALSMAKREGLAIPVIYNCGGYESVETLRMLEEYVDVYLPDYKYADSELAAKYSGAADYPEVAFAAIQEMVRQKKEVVFDEKGHVTSGVIVRHLILPGHKKNSKAALEKLYMAFGEKIYFSLMSQYTPLPFVEENYPELARRVTKREYENVVDYALSLGITNAYIQDGKVAKESFIPDFAIGEIV